MIVRDSLKGRASLRKAKSRASCVHCPNDTRSHPYVFVSFFDAFNSIPLMLFRLLLSKKTTTEEVHSRKEQNRASLEILILKAIVWCCVFIKILALSGEEEGNILVLEELKKQ